MMLSSDQDHDTFITAEDRMFFNLVKAIIGVENRTNDYSISQCLQKCSREL